MVHFLIRLLAYISLAISVMFAVIDATRSIGMSEFVYTRFGESFELVAPQLLINMQDWLALNAPVFVSEELVATVLQFPTFAVFAVLALMLYAIGRQPERRELRSFAR